VYWNSPHTGATNSTHFCGIGGGYRDATGAYLSFKNIGLYRFNQTFTGGSPNNVGSFGLEYNSSNITYPLPSTDFNTGGSVRLIRL
jgi:hypothetical protein